MSKTPPRPADWKLTMADLFAEVKAKKREYVGYPESEWAIEYERSLLATDLRFPQQGDVYEAIKPVTVSYLTSWRSPSTGGDKATLQPGDRVHLPRAPSDPQPISIYAVAVDYRALEKRFVPFLVRYHPLYRDFYFSIDVIDLHRNFRLINPCV